MTYLIRQRAEYIISSPPLPFYTPMLNETCLDLYQSRSKMRTETDFAGLRIAASISRFPLYQYSPLREGEIRLLEISVRPDPYDDRKYYYDLAIKHVSISLEVKICRHILRLG